MEKSRNKIDKVLLIIFFSIASSILWGIFAMLLFFIEYDSQFFSSLIQDFNREKTALFFIGIGLLLISAVSTTFILLKKIKNYND